MKKVMKSAGMKDFLICLCLIPVIGIIASSALGYFTEGLSAPISYYAGDDFTLISQMKQLTQEPWIWSTDRLGAPFGQEVYDYSANFLQTPEYLLIKFWTLFTHEVPVLENLVYLSTFVLCGLSAYLVMRKLRFRPLFSVSGAILYAFIPFIFGRGLQHFCLSACYFVPVAVYLCHASYSDENYLKFDRSLFRWKTLGILAACWCVANNGIGYYPFFACFLLCVTALCRLLETRRLRSMLPQIKLVGLIICFMLLALLPTFIYHAGHGSNNVAARIPSDAETYSLKITQMFMPMYTHGLSFLTNIVNEYNLNMPLVNENNTSYLGVVGCLGFLAGLLVLFRRGEKNELETNPGFFARMNLAAVLFMTVGGFISLLAVISRIYVMRGFNRISVHVMFCSLLILFYFLQHLYEKITRPAVRGVFIGALVLMTAFGLWDQTPTLVSDGSTLRFFRQRWENDDAFVSEIEEQLKEGDMVFQLPYHKYPESGSVNNMRDYHLLTGHIHSDTLRWSYGGVKGRESDRWNEYVSNLETQEMVDTLVSAGFRGIYIDRRAYTVDEFETLTLNIERVTEAQALVSGDGCLIFYNLYPYLDNRIDLLEKDPLSLEDIAWPRYSWGDVIDFTASGYTAGLYVEKGLSSPEEKFTWTLGDQLVIKMTVNGAKQGDPFDALLNLENVLDVQHITVSVNGFIVSEQELRVGDSVRFGGQVGENGTVRIVIDLPDCKSPKDLGMSADERKLGIAIRTLTLTEAE